MVCWGFDEDGRSTPPAGETFAAISSGETQTCGLRADDSIVCWGDEGRDPSKALYRVKDSLP